MKKINQILVPLTNILILLCYCLYGFACNNFGSGSLDIVITMLIIFINIVACICSLSKFFLKNRFLGSLTISLTIFMLVFIMINESLGSFYFSQVLSITLAFLVLLWVIVNADSYIE